MPIRTATIEVIVLKGQTPELADVGAMVDFALNRGGRNATFGMEEDSYDVMRFVRFMREQELPHRTGFFADHRFERFPVSVVYCALWYPDESLYTQYIIGS